MNARTEAFQLILPGNTNVPAMINAILRATVELRTNARDNFASFNPIHIFHTEESLAALRFDNTNGTRRDKAKRTHAGEQTARTKHG